MQKNLIARASLATAQIRWPLNEQHHTVYVPLVCKNLCLVFYWFVFNYLVLSA